MKYKTGWYKNKPWNIEDNCLKKESKADPLVIPSEIISVLIDIKVATGVNCFTCGKPVRPPPPPASHWDAGHPCQPAGDDNDHTLDYQMQR